jgi:hypothetical protein
LYKPIGYVFHVNNTSPSCTTEYIVNGNPESENTAVLDIITYFINEISERSRNWGKT